MNNINFNWLDTVSQWQKNWKFSERLDDFEVMDLIDLGFSLEDIKITERSMVGRLLQREANLALEQASVSRSEIAVQLAENLREGSNVIVRHLSQEHQGTVTSIYRRKGGFGSKTSGPLNLRFEVKLDNGTTVRNKTPYDIWLQE
jgi:hypothetical protein